MRDLHAVIPGSIRVTRGKLNMKGLAEYANRLEASNVIVIESWRGGVGCIRFYRVGDAKLTAVPPILYVKGYRLRRDYRKVAQMPRRRPTMLVILKPQKPWLKRLAQVLSQIFNAKLVSEEFISTSEVFLQIMEDSGVPRLAFFSSRSKEEVGPSITLRAIGWDVK
ncbi:MAG: hypothetical protein QXJ75_02355 [Candidatus Bathyarchaeia archaeon]